MNVELLKKVCFLFGPTGREALFVEYLKKELSDAGFEVSIDNLGNLKGFRGKEPYELFVTNTDQRSWVVEHKDAEGVMHLKTLPSGPVQEGGWALDEKGNRYLVSPSCDGKEQRAEPLFAGDISAGTFLVRAPEFFETDNSIYASALSDRLASAILLELASKSGEIKKPVAFLFYTGKHLGYMGLTSSMAGMSVSNTFVLEAMPSPSQNSEGSVLLPVRTQRSIPSSNTREYVSDLAAKEKVVVRNTINLEHSSASDILARAGLECAVLGIPLERHAQGVEKVRKTDYDALLKLVWRLVK